MGTHTDGSGVGGYGTVLLGYRLHPVNGSGFNFRVGFSAIYGPGMSLSIEDPGSWGIIPWGYISLGGSF